MVIIAVRKTKSFRLPPEVKKDIMRDEEYHATPETEVG